MRLKPTKSVGLGDIISFVIKGCSLILSPALKHIFILAYYCSIFQHHGSNRPLFPPSRKATAPLLVIVGLFISIEISVNSLKL